MMTFIRHHIAEPLTVARVAEAARCSETTAQRLFRRHTGASMQSWIRHTRLREAASLLRTTGLRVGEVASHIPNRVMGVIPDSLSRIPQDLLVCRRDY